MATTTAAGQSSKVFPVQSTNTNGTKESEKVPFNPQLTNFTTEELQFIKANSKSYLKFVKGCPKEKECKEKITPYLNELINREQKETLLLIEGSTNVEKLTTKLAELNSDNHVLSDTSKNAQIRAIEKRINELKAINATTGSRIDTKM
jgi:hypothetical protein